MRWNCLNPEKVAQIKRFHRALHREALNAKARMWYANNRERVSEQRKAAYHAKKTK
jgi:hypothetical protein